MKGYGLTAVGIWVLARRRAAPRTHLERVQRNENLKSIPGFPRRMNTLRDTFGGFTLFWFDGCQRNQLPIVCVLHRQEVIPMDSALRITAVCLLFACVGFCQAVQETSSLDHQDFETTVASGTKLRLHLHEGNFRVIGSASDKISIHVDGKNLGQAGNIRIGFKRANGTVDLTLSHVPKNELQVTIKIPVSTDLYARMRGGDLLVEGVRGDKDLELTGGDLTIQVGNPEEYSQVDLSVRFGDVSGTQFGDPKGWLGNSVRKLGTGTYRLHAHVMAGDLILKS